MDNNRENTVYCGVNLTQKQKETIQKIAKRNYRTITGQIRFMIDNWCRKFEENEKPEVSLGAPVKDIINKNELIKKEPEFYNHKIEEF